MIIDKNGDKWYKVGLHIHTTITDGRVSPEEAARIYKDAGFDAIAITDHWTYGFGGELSGLKILSGAEYNIGDPDTSNLVIHIVGVGMKSDPKLQKNHTCPQTAIDSIKSNGGMVILAHPAWSLNTVEQVKDLSGIDCVEIYNSVSNIEQSTRPYSGYFIDIAANSGIVYNVIATDDAHYYTQDAAKSFIMVKSESLESDDIINAIKSGDFYASQGPELYVKKVDGKVIVECSKCEMINFLSNSSWECDRIHRSHGITYAEYNIKNYEKWVRVEVLDEDGNYAWSNVINLNGTNK